MLIFLIFHDKNKPLMLLCVPLVIPLNMPLIWLRWSVTGRWPLSWRIICRSAKCRRTDNFRIRNNVMMDPAERGTVKIWNEVSSINEWMTVYPYSHTHTWKVINVDHEHMLQQSHVSKVRLYSWQTLYADDMSAFSLLPLWSKFRCESNNIRICLSVI